MLEYADRVIGAQGRSEFAVEWPEGRGWKKYEGCFVRFVASICQSFLVHMRVGCLICRGTKGGDSALGRAARWIAIGSLLRLEVSLGETK